MARSEAKTVEAYLAELPEDRRKVVSKVRDTVRKNLAKGFEEGMSYGMIGWQVPLARFSNTHNGDPLGFAALAAQKGSYSLYLIGCYMDAKSRKALEDAFRKAGKKLDMGKSCVRFKSLDDLPLEAIGQLVKQWSVDDFVATYEKSRAKATSS